MRAAAAAENDPVAPPMARQVEVVELRASAGLRAEPAGLVALAAAEAVVAARSASVTVLAEVAASAEEAEAPAALRASGSRRLRGGSGAFPGR